MENFENRAEAINNIIQFKNIAGRLLHERLKQGYKLKDNFDFYKKDSVDLRVIIEETKKQINENLTIWFDNNSNSLSVIASPGFSNSFILTLFW